jgi:tRNA-Thr(GGU) m(6)t(6)A37 methyltransferase TsaA
VSHDHRPTLPAGAGGLEAFDHALALFWFHQLDAPRERSTLHIDSPYRFGPAWLGTFATRAPVRPNPIGITAIRLLDVDPASGRIRVPFIDALDQTPVLDIKPYVPALDRVRDVEPPPWCAHWPGWVEEAGTFGWAAENNPST